MIKNTNKSILSAGKFVRGKAGITEIYMCDGLDETGKRIASDQIVQSYWSKIGLIPYVPNKNDSTCIFDGLVSWSRHDMETLSALLAHCGELYVPLDPCGGNPPDKGSVLGTRWRHQMETFSALLAICAGNSLARADPGFEVRGGANRGDWYCIEIKIRWLHYYNIYISNAIYFKF